MRRPSHSRRGSTATERQPSPTAHGSQVRELLKAINDEVRNQQENRTVKVLPLLLPSGKTLVFSENTEGETFVSSENNDWPLDFEFIPTVSQIPHLTHETTLTVDPGVLYSLGHGLTVGLRAAFDIDSSRVGIVPLVNKSWKLGNQNGFFKTFFAEIDLPVKFSRPPGGPAANPVTLATQFGLGF